MTQPPTSTPQAVSPEGYIQLELMLDVDSLTLTGIEYMEDAFQGWERNPGNPDTIMIEGSGQIAGEVYDQASQMPPEAVMQIGTSIYNIPFEEGTEATAQGTFTFDDTAQPGAIDAGTPVSVPHPSGTPVLFNTVPDILVTPNSSVTVDLIADDAGAQFNGAFGSAELIDPVQGLDTIVVTEAVNGTNPETAQAYLDRLSTTLTTLTPRPILPQDHATLVATNVPGVARATAIDLLCPGTGAAPGGIPGAIRDPNEVAYFQGKTPPVSPPVNNLTNEPRCTTVAILPDDPTLSGAALTALMQQAWNYLDANREVNFLNYVIPPSFTTIEVKAELHPYPGFIGADVIAAAAGMIKIWLSPENFGANPGSPVGQEWANDTLIRHDEAVDYLNRASGVFWTRNVQLRKEGDVTWSNGDITMTGVAPLPLIKDTGIILTIV
jgi:Baseplate J-like protein